MTGIHFIEFIVRQALVQIVTIYRQHTGIVVARDNLHGRFNRRQELAELWQLGLVGTEKPQ